MKKNKETAEGLAQSFFDKYRDEYRYKSLKRCILTFQTQVENKTLSHVLSLLNDVLENDNLHDFDQLYADIEDIAGQIKHLLSGESCNDEEDE